MSFTTHSLVPLLLEAASFCLFPSPNKKLSWQDHVLPNAMSQSIDQSRITYSSHGFLLFYSIKREFSFEPRLTGDGAKLLSDSGGIISSLECSTHARRPPNNAETVSMFAKEAA